MQTNFTLTQLKSPATAEADRILRACVHCGFCTATCPTFTLFGDELDSPRGRIYLIKDMLEKERAADPLTVKHIDRCLSCLACMSACPSGVNYMHLVDRARGYIEETYRRPLADRLLRAALGAVLPYRRRFRLAVALAPWARPFAPFLGRFGTSGRRLAAMADLAPRRRHARGVLAGMARQEAAALPARRVARVALLQGCVQEVLRPSINAAARRLLARLGIEAVTLKEEVCCGALLHHLGKEKDALAQVRHNVDIWDEAARRGNIDAVVSTASGCGTMIKDYDYLLRTDDAYAAKAARVAALAKDITEVLGTLALPAPARAQPMAVAYNSACSMQHGQRIDALPKKLLRQAGFKVSELPESHMCCGSAGTYNILEPEIAERLRRRKIENIMKTAPDCVATGNIGCIVQIENGCDLPVLHTVELLDFAYGGPVPEGL